MHLFLIFFENILLSQNVILAHAKIFKFRQILSQNSYFNSLFKEIEHVNDISSAKDLVYEADGEFYFCYMGVKAKKISAKSKSSKFFYNKKSIIHIFEIMCSIYTQDKLNLCGPPGVGKTAICEIAS